MTSGSSAVVQGSSPRRRRYKLATLMVIVVLALPIVGWLYPEIRLQLKSAEKESIGFAPSP